MEPLRIVSAAALGAWLGAAAFVSFLVAPAAFEALPRQEAGTFVGKLLLPIFAAGIAAGALAVVAAVREPTLPKARIAAAGSLVVLSITSLAVRAQVSALRALPEGDPARASFGAWHGASIAILLAAMLAAGLSIAVSVKKGV